MNFKLFPSMTDANRAKILAGTKTQTRRLKRQNIEAGEIMILREPLVKTSYYASYADDGNSVVVGAESLGTIRVMFWEWKVKKLQSRYMPKIAGRKFVKVLRVWSEPLGNITEADAIAEGCVATAEKPADLAFMDLWDSIHGDGSFDIHKNETIHCIEFKLYDPRCD